WNVTADAHGVASAAGQCDAVTPVELDVDVPQGATALDTVQAIAILADAAQRGQVNDDTTIVLADEAFIAVAAAADRQAQRVFNSQLHGLPHLLGGAAYFDVGRLAGEPLVEAAAEGVLARIFGQDAGAGKGRTPVTGGHGQPPWKPW